MKCEHAYMTMSDDLQFTVDPVLSAELSLAVEPTPLSVHTSSTCPSCPALAATIMPACTWPYGIQRTDLAHWLGDQCAVLDLDPRVLFLVEVFAGESRLRKHCTVWVTGQYPLGTDMATIWTTTLIVDVFWHLSGT